MSSPVLGIAAENVEPWLAGLRGKHKQFFDMASAGAGAPLGRIQNFLDVYEKSYGLRDTDLNAIVGAHGSGLALVLGDGVWERYALGQYFGIDDPAAKQPATRNVFAGTHPDDASASVVALQHRAVRFLACRSSIARVSRALAASRGLDAATVEGDLTRGLRPDVTPVPAMIVATNLAQEAGLTYVFVQ
jgi:hypothetical protein